MSQGASRLTQHDGVPEDVESTRTLIVTEYAFVGSFIPMYRAFQVQAVGLTMTIYAAALTIIGAQLDELLAIKPVGLFAGCIVSFPVSLLVTAFGVMELRIRRANLYITKTLASAAQGLVSPSAFKPLMFGSGASPHLSSIESGLASSVVFVALMALPSICFSTWFILFEGDVERSLFPAALTGLVVLVASSVFAVTVSARQVAPKKKTEAVVDDATRVDPDSKVREVPATVTSAKALSIEPASPLKADDDHSPLTR